MGTGGNGESGMNEGVTILKPGAGRMIPMTCGLCDCQFEVDNRKCFFGPVSPGRFGDINQCRLHHYFCPECSEIVREVSVLVRREDGLSTFKAVLIALVSAIIGVTSIVAFI